MLADVQCVPSLWEEAAGLVVIEAMAEGIPTIVTNSGGMVEYVNEDSTLVVEREDIIENLKKAIIHLKECPEIRRKMSDAARKQSKKYNEAIYYKNFIEVIDKIIDENREITNDN